MTGRQMCEAVSAWLASKHNITIAPEAIWNMSPSGELWPVYALYERCRSEGMADPQPAQA